MWEVVAALILVAALLGLAGGVTLLAYKLFRSSR
jgi:hypothetical protein